MGVPVHIRSAWGQIDAIWGRVDSWWVENREAVPLWDGRKSTCCRGLKNLAKRSPIYLTNLWRFVCLYERTEFDFSNSIWKLEREARRTLKMVRWGVAVFVLFVTCYWLDYVAQRIVVPRSEISAPGQKLAKQHLRIQNQGTIQIIKDILNKEFLDYFRSNNLSTCLYSFICLISLAFIPSSVHCWSFVR